MTCKAIRLFSTLLFILIHASIAHNQCPDNNSLTFASPTDLTPSGVGNTVTNSAVWSGEYVIVNLTSGVEYRFQSCTPPAAYDSYLTVIRSSNGTPLTWSNVNNCNTGHENFTWVSTYTGESRFLLDQWNGSSCVTNGTNTVLSVTQLTALPIEMTGFSADPTPSKSIKLIWSTATEHNNSHFVVMRSTDGKNFKEIITVEGVGKSDMNVEYSYEDKSIEPNRVYYYYLVQVDLDGTSTNSYVVSSIVKDQARLFLGSLFPNPIVSQSILRYNAPEKPVRFTILDINGNVRYDQSFATNQTGLNEFGINPQIMGLSPGLYFIKASSGNDSFLKKFLVAKE